MSARRPAALLVLAVAVSAATACRTVVKDVPPPVALPPQFSRPGQGAAASATEARWWAALGDPHLDALVDEALARNFSLGAALARLDQAKAIVRRDSSGLFPDVDATAGRSKSWRRQPDPSDPGDFEIVDSGEYSLGLNASYEVDLWGRVRSARNAAVLDARASEEDLRAAAVAVSAQVASAWFQLREQRDQLQLIDKQIATNEQVLELITARFRRGLVEATDVLQQRQLVESRRGEREEVLGRIETFENAVAVLVGRAPRTPVPATDAELADPGRLPATGIPAEALARRPDVRAAYLAIQSADQELASAIANRYPRVSIVASWETSDNEVRDLFDNWIATIGANLAAPLVDGGERRAEVARNRAVVQERIALYGNALLVGLREAEDALAQEERQRALVDSLGKQLELAREVVRRTRVRYQQGDADYLRVLDAEESLQSLERRVLQAKRELVGFRIDLHRALSGGWEVRRPEPQEQVAKAGMANDEGTEAAQ